MAIAIWCSCATRENLTSCESIEAGVNVYLLDIAVGVVENWLAEVTAAVRSTNQIEAMEWRAPA